VYISALRTAAHRAEKRSEAQAVGQGAIRRGDPAPARDFLMGYINIELAIVFNEIDWQFSAGAQKEIEEAKKVLLQPDVKRVFEPASIREDCGHHGHVSTGRED